jgi:acid stress-induced BolA-like protein IbaG/YrbA
VGTLHAECSPLHAQEQIETSVCKASLPGLKKASGDERVFQIMIVGTLHANCSPLHAQVQIETSVCARLCCQAHASQEFEKQVVLSKSFKP